MINRYLGALIVLSFVVFTSATTFNGGDIIGIFNLFNKLTDSQQCPPTIEHRGVEISSDTNIRYIPHSMISHDSVNCTSDGKLEVFDDDHGDNIGAASRFKLSMRTKSDEFINLLFTMRSPFVSAIDATKRICGSSTLPAETSIIFLRHDGELKVSGLENLTPYSRLMILYRGTPPEPCIYIADPIGNVSKQPGTNPTVTSSIPSNQVPSYVSTPSPPVTSPSTPTEQFEKREVTVSAPTEEPLADLDEPTTTVEVVESTPISSQCLPADALVTLPSGIEVRIDTVSHGTLILASSKGASSPIVLFSHREGTIITDFVELTTSSGSIVSLTPGHYLSVNDRLQAAGRVKIGDKVILSSGHRSEIVYIRTVQKRGLYNPHTADGRIVVNGIVLSTYTAALSPALAHALLAPVRTIARISVDYSSEALLGYVQVALSSLLFS